MSSASAFDFIFFSLILKYETPKITAIIVAKETRDIVLNDSLNSRTSERKPYTIVM